MTPHQFRRRDLRLLEHDYATPGSYFVTVCVQNRACVLGEIVDGVTQLSAVGSMSKTHLFMAIDRYGGVEIDSYVLMPNHLHAIINIGWTLDPLPVDAHSQEAGNGHESSHGGLHLREEGVVPEQSDDKLTSPSSVM